MSDSSADRQRRFRAHRQGDHTLCDPARCNGTPDVPVTLRAPVTRSAEAQSGDAEAQNAGPFGARGNRLWTELAGDGVPLRPTERVLAEEACRAADRLDTLDRMLRGDQDTWVILRAVSDYRVEVVVNGLLAEARQQQGALKALLTELRQSRTPVARSPRVAPGPIGIPEGVTGVADLTARIAARRALPAG